MSLYYLGNSRSEPQTERMKRLEAEGVCIFCPQFFGHDDVEVPLLTIAGWNIFENMWPYNGAAIHLLASPSTHVTRLDELGAAERHGYWEVIDWFWAEYHASAYGEFSRNGENALSAGTISHLHKHLIVPDAEADVPVRAKLSSPYKTRTPTS